LCHAPGGFGPGPIEGDELHSSCEATASGVTGKATFVKGILTLTTDAGGSPLTQESIPDSPPVNYVRSSIITNVGDVFIAVFNEQIANSDGSLTVNAFHMYMFGPTAVGESVGGQVICGLTPSAAAADTQAPYCSILDIEPMAPDNPTPKTPRVELLGVVDAGGLKSIDNIQSTNATVDVGNPDPSTAPYLHLSSGQTTPAFITATSKDDSQPMTWSFDATDMAGNVTHKSQCPTNSVIQGVPVDPANTTAGGGGGGGSGSGSGAGGGTSDTSGTDSAAGTSGSGSGAAGQLGKTGIEVLRLVLAGGGLVIAGSMVVTAARRRRRSASEDTI
jgi:hypothetical protein